VSKSLSDLALSANTMFGFLPPSSTATRLMVGAAARMIACPVARPPVKLIMSTPECSVSGAPTLRPSPSRMLTTPCGAPASSSSRTSSTDVRGVTSLGLITTVFPAASAGATFQDSCSSG
jgi:hypothetical protein